MKPLQLHLSLAGLLLLSACATTPDRLTRAEEDFFQDSGVSSELLAKALADPGNGRIDSLLVLRRGETLLERYYHGESADTPHDLRSATKTVTGLLVGIALDRGLLTSVDQSILDWFPEQKDRGIFGAITIRHLLTMTSGLDSDDWDPRSPGNEELMYQQRSWVGFFFSLKKADEPGTRFRYSTAGVVLLGELLHRAAGMRFDEFARSALFAPLGIVNARFDVTPAGEIDSGGHLRLTTRDFVKIASLALNEGRFEGRQVVSASWLKTSLTPQVRVTGAPETGPWFGYLWWLEPVVDGRPKSYQARGNGGQLLIVVPEKDLVAAFTGSAYNSNDQMQPFLLMMRYVIPSLGK